MKNNYKKSNKIFKDKVNLFNNDKLVSIIGTIQDITDKKNSENKLAEIAVKLKSSEERYSATISVTGALVYDYNVLSGEIIWQGQVKEITGYSENEFGNSIDDWEKIIHPKDKDSVIKELDLCMNKHTKYLVEYRIKIKSGEYIWVEDVGKFLYDQNNKPYRMLGIMRDIRDRKALDDAKTRFLSIASHQLRTPLSITKWVLESMLSENNLTQKQKAEYNDLVYSNERLIKLVNDLLNVSTIDTGKLIVNKKDVDIKELLNNVVDSIKAFANKNNKKINIIFSTKQTIIYCDPDLIREALENLLTNAINYSDKNSQEIYLEIGERTNDYLISVKNEGIISTQIQEKIKKYEKFVRGSNAPGIQPAGSGLGLYIANKVIEASGGSVWFESNTKSGTTFYMTIIKKQNI